MIALQPISPKPWLFAAKTTAACLIGLFVAFLFNLDQPQWTALTVFIVAQPQSTGGVVGKACFRIVGTFVGCVVALALVGLFAQERVLFLGSLAIWVGLCTFASQRVRSWANYGCVLAGYTAAIVGIPAALVPANAFYYANARFTEICLGIVVGACVAGLFAPAPMARSLKDALAEARRRAARYVASVLNGVDAGKERAAVIAGAARVDELMNSAVFEDQPTRQACDRIRSFAGALVDVIASAEPLERQFRAAPRHVESTGLTARDRAGAEAAEAIAAWETDSVDSAGLVERLCDSLSAAQPAPEPPDASSAAPANRLETLLSSFTTLVFAWEAVVNGRPAPRPPFPLDPADDLFSAAMTGLRSTFAVAIPGLFWVLTAWPEGSSATLLCALGVSRASTMGRVVPLGLLTATVFVLVSLPTFVIVEVLLPQASGFPMLTLILAPMMLLCAYLMAFRQTLLLGYMAVLYFFTATGIQNRMAYNPIGFVNLTIAALLACGLGIALWAVVAPDSPPKQRLRFVRATTKAMRSLRDAGDGAARLGRFESAVGGALVRLSRELNLAHPQDQACEQVAFALLGAGRELACRSSARQAFAAGGVERDSAVERIVSAIRDCLKTLSRRTVAAGELLRAAETLGAAMDAFAQRRSSPSSEVEVTSDAR
jgi:uncharacterized membrane protein YccC